MHTLHTKLMSPLSGPIDLWLSGFWAGILPRHALVTGTAQSHAQSTTEEAGLHPVPCLAAVQGEQRPSGHVTGARAWAGERSLAMQQFPAFWGKRTPHVEVDVPAGTGQDPSLPLQEGERLIAQPARPRESPASHRSMVLSLLRRRRASSFELLLSSCCCSRNFICFCREASAHRPLGRLQGLSRETSWLMRTAGSWEHALALNAITTSAAQDYGV